jgi:DNA-binding transcriptional LysR family regulator
VGVPQQKWLMSVAWKRPIACEISDINGHLIAARARAGVARLPDFWAAADPKLQRVTYEGEPFSRDIGMAVHQDLLDSPQIRAVTDFLLRVVAENPVFAENG